MQELCMKQIHGTKHSVSSTGSFTAESRSVKILVALHFFSSSLCRETSLHFLLVFILLGSLFRAGSAYRTSACCFLVRDFPEWALGSLEDGPEIKQLFKVKSSSP